MDLAALLSRKNEDYAPGDEFSNFSLAAQFAGITTEESIKSQLGIKWTRLESLFESGKVAANESIEDNLMDLAGYAIILAAYLRYLEAENRPMQNPDAEGYM